MFEFPRMAFVRQHFPRPRIENPAAAVAAALQPLRIAERIRPGASIAVTAGSRGIADIRSLLPAVAAALRQSGAEPFLVPAMGSHGGATPEGQLAVLRGLGITPESCGCPILSSLETDILWVSPSGFTVHLDRHAARADHLLLVNRIKPHTTIAGPFESGLAKMLLIGLGKQRGAEWMHRAMGNVDFEAIVREVLPEVVRRANVLGGLAIIENAFDEVARLEAVDADRLLEREPLLLEEARRSMARLPFDDIDLLLIDQIGKNLSGTGMDTNVVGRKRNDHVALGDERPRIKRIAVRSLSPETKGNAIGIGLAEFCHERAVAAIDRRATYINCLTSAHPTSGMLPMHFDSDREMLQTALGTIGWTEPAAARVVWIRDTLHLERLRCSERLLAELDRAGVARPASAPQPLDFDRRGDLTAFADGALWV